MIQMLIYIKQGSSIAHEFAILCYEARESRSSTQETTNKEMITKFFHS